MCRLFAYQYIMVLCVLYTVHCIRGGVQCYASIAAHFKNENLFDFYLIHLILIMILQFCCAAIRFISINNYKLKPNQNRKLWIRKYFVFNIWLLKSNAHTHARAHTFQYLPNVTFRMLNWHFIWAAVFHANTWTVKSMSFENYWLIWE